MTPQTVSPLLRPAEEPRGRLASRARVHGDAGAACRQRRHQLEILSRELKRPLHVNIDYTDADIPPTATIDGIDLVTEAS